MDTSDLPQTIEIFVDDFNRNISETDEETINLLKDLGMNSYGFKMKDNKQQAQKSSHFWHRDEKPSDRDVVAWAITQYCCVSFLCWLTDHAIYPSNIPTFTSLAF
ncbi:unnamed protein product [Heterobilharzia americana]|nr:unnamed protein product [Heterobilharzia americana]